MGAVELTWTLAHRADLHPGVHLQRGRERDFDVLLHGDFEAFLLWLESVPVQLSGPMV
jgi:hypothetical protein